MKRAVISRAKTGFIGRRAKNEPTKDHAENFQGGICGEDCGGHGRGNVILVIHLGTAKENTFKKTLEMHGSDGGHAVKEGAHLVGPGAK